MCGFIESFTCYSETLYTESLLGKEKVGKYIKGIKNNIQKRQPYCWKYGVKNEGSGDICITRCKYIFIPLEL